MNNTPENEKRSETELPDDAGMTQLRSTVHDIPHPAEEKEPDEPVREGESKGSRMISGTIRGLVAGIIYICAIVVVGVSLAIFAIIPIANDVFAFVKEEKVVDITVPELATINDISELLYENGIIAYPQVFKIYAGFSDDDGQFLAGDYSISTSLNYSQILDSFKPSSERQVISLTFPEGVTTDEIINMFVEAGIGTKEGFVAAINEYDWSEEYSYWFIDELEENGWNEDRFYRLDGYLYPDTYYFYTNSTEVAAIAKLLDNFNVKFTDTYRDYAENLGFTVDEIITLASMVECEAKYLSEFSYVSSVFHNRLDNSAYYPYLESDATIMYAILHDTGERPETLTGTNYDTPYNTYHHRGLPPGPIANPGYNAITYALYPKITDYFYFVANNDGYSVFSETYSDHKAAIQAVADGTAISTVLQGMTSVGEEYEDDEIE